jgi:hypothetical protein
MLPATQTNPPGQTAGDTVAAAQNFPAGHTAQSLSADFPAAKLYVPAGHGYCVTNWVPFGQ